MTIDEMKAKLTSMLTEKRYNHSVSVMETAMKMAVCYGCDEKKAQIAGLLHDCAKNYTASEMIRLCDEYNVKLDDISKRQTGLIHGFLGAEMIKDVFGVNDDEIYDAVKYHTVGKPDMPLLTKIIYIADVIEPNRHFEGVDILRKMAFDNIDKALVLQIDMTIKNILQKGTLIHTNTIDARNYYLSR